MHNSRSAQYPRSPGLRPFANPQDDKKPCHCEEQTKSATSQSQNLQTSTIMRLLRFARNDKKYNSKQLTVSSERFIYNKKNTSRFTIDVSRFKAAFTLAEVLITLSIIGIVAAMTMPSLIAKHQEKVTVTKLKKTYSVLSQAFQMAKNDYGDPLTENWNVDLPEDMRPRTAAPFGLMNTMAKYIKYSKKCNSVSCNYASIKYTDKGGVVYNYSRNNIPKMVLNDGTILYFAAGNTIASDCSINYADSKMLSNICTMIDVDINGEKGPNLYGEDLFSFYLTRYGILPDGSQDEEPNPWGNFDACKTDGYGCTSWIIQNENLDFKKCPDELSWEKTSCDK